LLNAIVEIIDKWFKTIFLNLIKVILFNHLV